MIYRKFPILLFAFLLGCVEGATGEESQTPQPITELNPVVVEAAGLIGQAAQDCEDEILKDWKSEVNVFVENNWDDILASLPSTSTVSLNGGRLFATGSDDAYSQRYELDSGTIYALAVEGRDDPRNRITQAELVDHFSLVIEDRPTPPPVGEQLIDDIPYNPKFECVVPRKSHLLAKVRAESWSVWETDVSLPSHPRSPVVTVRLLEGSGNTEVKACIDSTCVEHKLGDLFNELQDLLSGESLLLGGSQIQIFKGPAISGLMISREMLDVAEASD